MEQILAEVRKRVEAEKGRMDKTAKPEEREAKRVALPFPNVMNGAAGYFAQVMSTYLEPPEHFFFLSYLTALGSILGSRLTLVSELRPQPRLYTVILGESADDRKSTAISKTCSFFHSAVMDFKPCYGVNSAEGLQKKLEKDGSTLLVFDELRAFVGKAKADGSVLLPCVTSLFDLNHYESNTKDREVILSNAYLSILAASTVETYERTWDSSFTDIGMTNRLFIVPGAGRRRFAIPGRVPRHEWEAMKYELAQVLKAAADKPELDVTPAARALYEHWYLNLEQTIHTKRLDTYAMKFMLLLAVNAEKTEIDEDVMGRVIELSNWQLRARRLHDPINADSKIATIEEKIRRLLEVGPMTEFSLKRAIHYNRIGTWVFDNARKNLQKSQEITFDKESKKWKRL